MDRQEAISKATVAYNVLHELNKLKQTNQSRTKNQLQILEVVQATQGTKQILNLCCTFRGRFLSIVLSFSSEQLRDLGAHGLETRPSHS